MFGTSFYSEIDQTKDQNKYRVIQLYDFKFLKQLDYNLVTKKIFVTEKKQMKKPFNSLN